MINARAAMMTPGLNYLTFQHLDKMFATRPVKAGPSALALDTAPRDIGDSFTFEKTTISLQDFWRRPEQTDCSCFTTARSSPKSIATA